MTITTLLNTYDGSMNLKVGAADGSGFFYIGTVADFAENICDYDAATKSNSIRLVKKSKKVLRDTLANAPTLGSYAKQQLKTEEKIMTFDGFRAVAEKFFYDVNVKQKTLEIRSERLESYIPLADRNVRDYAMCDTAVEKNCLRVILDGYERGAYWVTADGKLPSVRFDDETEEAADGNEE